MVTVSRSTRQRSAIGALMGELNSFLSAQDIHALLRGRGAKVGLATVYRNLQSMARRGELDVVRRGDGESLYRRCASGTHHHHLVCRDCGFSVEIENEDVERWTKKAARRHRFTELTHDLEVFGLCERCSERSP
jgi:Fur family transcriptional regulator, ferric uptake regulator